MTSPVSPTTLPQLAASDVRLLWVNDWYDVPSEAVVEHAGRRCLLRLEDPSALDGSHPVRWILFPLDAEQLAEHMRWHDDYALQVGTHWCFHDEPHEMFAEHEADERQRERFMVSHRNKAPVPLASLTPVAWLDALPLR
jgi:hypothetical protein